MDLLTDQSLDLVDPPHFLGHESDAIVWHCIVRHLGSPVLAADDVGE